MTPERILENTNQTIKEHEEFLERLRVGGVDWSPVEEAPEFQQIAPPAPHRETFKVRVVSINSTRTEHDFSILSRDREEAEWLALSCAPAGSLRFTK